MIILIFSHSDVDFTNKKCGYEGTHESDPGFSDKDSHPTEFNRILRVNMRYIASYISSYYHPLLF